MASMPLLLKGVDGASYQDLAFHLSRIEGIREGLLAGKFPVMMQSVWMDGKGYPVSIFYGDALLYFPAILRILGVPVIAAYKVYVLVMNLLTALVAYLCFKDMYKNPEGAFLASLLYVTASYRMVDIYVRGAAGEYGAFLFFPLVAMAMRRILKEDTGNLKDYYKNSLWLALAMTGLIETHLLSTVMTVFLLVILCLLYAKRTFRPRTLACIGMAVGETLLLNLYYFVPFLDYYRTEPIYGGKGGDSSTALQIRQYGASVKQLFSFFSKPFGVNSYDAADRMQLTVGLPLMLVLFGALVYFVWRDRKYETLVVGIMACLSLLMSTNLFPWNTLEGKTHLFRFLAKVQFPWRYLAPAVLFLSILTAMLYARGARKKKTALMFEAAALVLTLAASVMTVVFTSAYQDGYTCVDYEDYSEVDSGYMGACEYLKNNTTLKDLSYVPENADFTVCQIMEEKDNSVTYYVENKDSQANLEVLKLNYKGYTARNAEGEKMTTYDGFNDLLTVVVPANYKGEIKISFEQPALWIAAEIISLLSLATLLYWLWAQRKQKALS